MPELPEVETLRRGLIPFVVGKKIASVSISRERVVREVASVDAFCEGLVGASVTELSRRAKYLVIHLEKCREVGKALILHMGMSGQIRSSALTGEESTRVPHSNFVLIFSDNSSVAFIDPRTFGKAYLEPFGPELELCYLSHLGPDAIYSADPLEKLRLHAQKSSRWIKQLLMDQALIGGIGNMYADEILYHACVAPNRLAKTITASEFDLITQAIPLVLNEAISLGGSSLADKTYRDVFGNLGRYQNMHRAYGREGQACLGCGVKILRIVTANRSSFFCPKCQR